MATKLESLELTELSLVPEGANVGATVGIFKSARTPEGEPEGEPEDNPEGESNGEETVDKSLFDAKVGELAQAINSLEGAQAQLVRLTKALEDNDYDILEDTIEKRAPIQYIEVEGEQIDKSKVPAVILKRLETQAQELEEQEIVKRLDGLMPNIGDSHARVLLKSLDALDVDAQDDFSSFLSSLDTMFANASEEIGKKAPKSVTPEDEIAELVKAYQSEHKVTSVVAYAEIAKTVEGAALITKSYNK